MMDEKFRWTRECDDAFFNGSNRMSDITGIFAMVDDILGIRFIRGDIASS
jgi:hypothetical protein